MENNSISDLIPNEEEGNFHYICKDCAEYHRKLFQESGAEPDVGDMVKVSFSGEKETEHMWAEITEINKDRETYIGTLANSPIVLTSMHYGQPVEFTSDQIMIYTNRIWSEEKAYQHIVDVMRKVQERHHGEHGKTKSK